MAIKTPFIAPETYKHFKDQKWESEKAQYT